MDKKFISRFLQGAASTSTGTLVTVIFHFLSITLMTRFVSKEIVGLYFLIIATATFFKLVASFGLDLTLVKFLSADNIEDKNEIVSIILLTRAIVLLFLSVVLFIGSDLILPLLGDGLEPFVLFIPIIFMGHSIRELFFYLLQGLQRFKQYALIQIISAILKFSFIFFFRQNLTLENLLYIEIAMLGGSILLQLLTIPFNSFGLLKRPFRKQIFVQAVKFGFPLYYTSLVATGGGKSSVFLINYFLNPAQIALYEVAIKIPEGVSRLLRSFVIVYFPNLSLLFSQDKRQEAVKVMNAAVSLNSILLTFMWVGAFLFGEEIISFIFSEQYANLGVALTAAMISVHLASVSNLFGYALVSAGKPKTSSIVNTISVFVLIVGNLIFIPIFGYIGAIYAAIFADITDTALYYLYLSRYGLAPSAYKVFQPIILGSCFCILVAFLGNDSFLIKALLFSLFVMFCTLVVSDLKNALHYLPAVGEKITEKMMWKRKGMNTNQF